MVSTKRVALLAVVLIAVLGALALFSLTVGMRAITLSGVLHALRSAGSQEPSDLVVWTLRLPRLLAALVCGVSFAVAGALMQGVTNNPLASPSILGINAGASFGLALAMIFLPAASLQVTIVSAFFGAALATAFILVLASLKHGLTPVYIALAGTAVSAVFLAVTQVLVVFFDVAQELSYWTAGGISGIRMTAILGVVPWTILGLILAVSVSRSVTLLSFGEDMAIGLGGRLSRIRLRAGLADPRGIGRGCGGACRLCRPRRAAHHAAHRRHRLPPRRAVLGPLGRAARTGRGHGRENGRAAL